MPQPRRGRPLKFGRPGQTITLTLPDDVVEWLHSLHEDPAWAIVGLFERRKVLARAPRPRQAAELVQLPGRRSLILVQPEVLKNVPGISLVPLSDGRAFIALDPGRGVADLEVAILDRLDAEVDAEERKLLSEFRRLLREWRQLGLKFQPRSILVVERQALSTAPRPLSALATRG